MIEIEFQGLKCTIIDGEWSCSDKTFQVVLTALEERLRTATVIGSDPNPELTSALFVIQELGDGKIVRDASEQEKFVPGRVY